MSLCSTRVMPLGAVVGSVSDLLGLRLSLPLQIQGHADTACEKVSGTFSQEVARHKSETESRTAPRYTNSAKEIERYLLVYPLLNAFLQGGYYCD